MKMVKMEKIGKFQRFFFSHFGFLFILPFFILFLIAPTPPKKSPRKKT
jgi:hypothetical protein